mmetsp:Transcript_7747/g.11414  ORF Transcript_7747/g.11414 Transcript_7747/m.11414 type:complete len:440 (-) Transcript_7747:30-1349(-)
MQSKLNDFFRLKHKDSTALRLPNHTGELWKFAQPRLLMIATTQNHKDQILETISDLVCKTRICFRHQVNLNALNQFLSQKTKEEVLDFFCRVATFALEVDFLFPNGVPMLLQRSNAKADLSLQQVRCLLALMFFCCFPKQEKSYDLPKRYHFYELFTENRKPTWVKLAKLQCVYNYFSREVQLNQKITFKRNYLAGSLNWSNCSKELSEVTIEESQTSTEELRDKLMVDYANCYIGGGVLSAGAVQEEIMFLKLVEPIVSLLFTEKLLDNEALVIIGTQRYNETTGYSNTFNWKSDFVEGFSLDEQGRANSHLTCIDALNYSGKEWTQYQANSIQRELQKAYVGFMSEGDTKEVVAGRWGCGVFAGDDQLKFLIQWLAASALSKNLYFLPWDMANLDQLRMIVSVLKGQTVDRIANLLFNMGRVQKGGVFQRVIEMLMQ